MNNADKPASSQYGKFDKDSQGLTKREYFAGLAMQAILSQQPPFDVDDEEMSEFMEVVGQYSKQAADALLNALEEK